MAQWAADILLYLHFIWVLFMLAGFWLALWWRLAWLRLLHFAGLLLYILLGVLGWYCPLTIGEEYFRQQAVPGFSYQGSFLASWVEKLIYVENWGAPLWLFRLLAGFYLVLCLTSWWWLPKDFFKRKTHAC
ncbi:DUF2784 family protein [candidate division FCPU426 bacterium]|nr:DUF2784 family protein [candidate division FCPU426 bacterium]